MWSFKPTQTLSQTVDPLVGTAHHVAQTDLDLGHFEARPPTGHSLGVWLTCQGVWGEWLHISVWTRFLSAEGWMDVGVTRHT